uniref:Pleckstrin homology domain containing J1 n=1 Tax=Bubo bubo TaxID=30461 RepID=A0A8C0FRA5_BUBBB
LCPELKELQSDFVTLWLQLSRGQPGGVSAEGALPEPVGLLKKRLVKLVVNFLFYFRTDEAEPIGALLLEHCRITKEEENVFSITACEERSSNNRRTMA